MKLLITVIIIVLLAIGWYFIKNRTEEHAQFVRPDGAYKVIVYRDRSPWSFAMPGQGSDAPGWAKLYDRDNNLLEEARVEMVQIVENVEWSNKHVRIKLVAEWELPN